MNKYMQVPNQHLIRFFKQSSRKDTFNIFQAGCNSGSNLKAIKEIYTHAECYGIDIQRDAIIQARQNFPDGKFYLGNIEESNLFQNQKIFDYILLPDILQHLIQPEKVLRYLHTTLKDDGQVYACIPNLMNWAVMYNLIINGKFSYTKTGLLDYDHKHLFTYYQIVDIFKKTGYGIDQIKSITIGKIPQDYKDFFTTLVSFSKTVDVFQYKTFSYMIKAHKV